MATHLQPTDRRWLTLFSFFRRLTNLAEARGAGSDAEDIVSTVLIRAWSHSELNETRLWPYLARAVCNEIIDRHRRLVTEQMLGPRTYVRPQPSVVEAEAIAKVEAARLLAILAERNSQQTVAMVRLRISGNTWGEIASRFEKPATAVQAQVRRALIGVRGHPRIDGLSA